MKTVSQFEASLLRILHGFFGRVSADRLLSLVKAEAHRPQRLSRNAVELVKNTLRKGVPYALAKEGGWKRERFLRNEKIAAGRLWHRWPPEELGLSFSKQSLEFLIWITANHPRTPRTKWTPDEAEFTIGDRLLFYLAAESLRGTEMLPGLMQQKGFSDHALVWLSSLDQLDDAKIRPPKSWDFSYWLSGQGAAVFECLQSRLAERWVQLEQNKLRISRPEEMRVLGSRQNRLLASLFDAAETADRRDLCRFFLIAIRRHLTMTEAGASAYQLEVKDLRLADRAEVFESAAAALRQTRRLDRWNREAVSTGFYDEGYHAAQLWKADWEELEGDRVCLEAGHRLQALEPIGPAMPNRTNPSENLSEK